MPPALGSWGRRFKGEAPAAGKLPGLQLCFVGCWSVEEDQRHLIYHHLKLRAVAGLPLAFTKARPLPRGGDPVLKWRMKFLLLCGGLLLLALGSGAFFVLLMRGSESILVYPAAVSMYLGLGLTLYAVMMWTDRED